MFKTLQQILIENRSNDTFHLPDANILKAMEEASEQAFHAGRSVNTTIDSNGMQPREVAPPSATYPRFIDFKLERL